MYILASGGISRAVLHDNTNILFQFSITVSKPNRWNKCHMFLHRLYKTLFLMHHIVIPRSLWISRHPNLFQNRLVSAFGIFFQSFFITCTYLFNTSRVADMTLLTQSELLAMTDLYPFTPCGVEVHGNSSQFRSVLGKLLYICLQV